MIVPKRKRFRVFFSIDKAKKCYPLFFGTEEVCLFDIVQFFVVIRSPCGRCCQFGQPCPKTILNNPNWFIISFKRNKKDHFKKLKIYNLTNKLKMYCKLVETFHIVNECKTAAYFSWSLIQALAQPVQLFWPLVTVDVTSSDSWTDSDLQLLIETEQDKTRHSFIQ